MWPPTGLIPWFSKTEGNTYATLLHHPFLFKGKSTQAQEVARRISGAVAGEAYAKSSQDLISQQLGIAGAVAKSSQDIPSTHHKFLSLGLHYLPFASRFPLPHFTLAVLFALSLHPPSLSLFASFFSFLVCLCVGLLACHDGSR